VELLFVAVGGALLGLAARYVVPGDRHTYGVLLTPAIGTAVTSAVWVALLWAGLTFDGGWIWLISLLVGTVAALAVPLVLPARRQAADRALLVELSRA
jgi:hypothetical protein